jgi:plastocyanin
MSTRITASLVVCVAAAGVAVGALALEPDDSPAPAAGTPPTSASQGPGGYSSADDAGADSGPGGGATIEIRGFEFAATTVAPGGLVTVDNRDSVSHTVTAGDGEFDSGEVPGGGAATLQAPDEPGTYGFACEIHPDMTGTLTVG